MKAFTELFENLEQSNTAQQKVIYILNYLETVNDAEKIWALYLMQNKRLSKIVTINQLLNWAKEESELSEWLFNISEASTKDIAELIALILPVNKAETSIELSKFLIDIFKLKEENYSNVKREVVSYWNQFNSDEKYILNKLLLGSFKINIDKEVLLQALSQYSEQSKYVLAYRLQTKWHPANYSYSELIREDMNLRKRLEPFEFKFSVELDKSIKLLGNANQWLVEHYRDGQRCQIIKRNDALYVWSDQYDFLTPNLIELNILKEKLKNGTVFDGIVVGFKDGKILNHQQLISRLKRKTTTTKLLKEIPVIFIAFDLLEIDGKDLLSKSLSIRRALLEAYIKDINLSILTVQEADILENWNQLSLVQKEAEGNLADGIFLKKISGKYNSKKPTWFKLKNKPKTIIGVLFYVTQNFGSNLEYTFALRKGEELISFVKTDTGLNKADEKIVADFIKENKLERFGPVRMVKPQLVFEIEFDSISISKRHKAGVVLKSPRIKAFYKNKKIEGIDTHANLLGMLKTD